MILLLAPDGVVEHCIDDSFGPPDVYEYHDGRVYHFETMDHDALGDVELVYRRVP